MNFENFKVELRRHIGITQDSILGLIPNELPQKLVLVYPPDLNGACRQAGIIGDDPVTKVSIFPHCAEEWTPKLVAWIKSEAYRLRDAGEFVDPPAPLKAEAV